MYITELILEQFRSYASASCTFAEPITVVVGKNASGKSNLLEAIRLVSTTRSVRARVESQLVRDGASVGRVIARYTSQNKDAELLCGLDVSTGRTKKIWKLQGAPKTSRSVVGLISTLLFKPEDVDLLQRSSSARRDLLDQLLVVRNQPYYVALHELKQVLVQRQALLETARSNPGTLADTYDQQLIRLSSYISHQRDQLLEELKPSIVEYVQQLNNNSDPVDARLITPSITLGDMRPNSPKEWESLYTTALNHYRSQEIMAARNLVGAHREDIYIQVNTKPTREFGSRGEWRSVVISFLLASLDYLGKKTGERPVLLLDDVLSELDPHRRSVLSPYMQKQQTILTTADPAELPKNISKSERLEINNNLITKAEYALS